MCKSLLPIGRGLYETVEEMVEGDILTARERIRNGSALAAIQTEAGYLPSTVTDELEPAEIEQLATTFQYAALQCGYAADDPCLHWFDHTLLKEFWPPLNALLLFETGLLEKIGQVAIEKGRAKAFAEMQELLGSPSQAERKDWTSLPMAYVRDFQGLTTDDDRQLMIARLEDLVVKCMDQLDLGKAQTTLRTIAQIQGLTFQDDERSQRQFALLFAQAHERSDERATVRDTEITRQLTAS